MAVPLGDKLIQNRGIGNANRISRVATGSTRQGPMDRQLLEWKLDVEQLWSAVPLDYRAAERLAADIANGSHDPVLRPMAAQALPSLRNASLEHADRGTRDEARRRLGEIRDLLRALDGAGFGQRVAAPRTLTAEQRHRQTLGLPLDRPLAKAEIHRAWKRAAKSAHPDAGGNAEEFLALSAAQDALMKER
jgi:hypothetical protein